MLNSAPLCIVGKTISAPGSATQIFEAQYNADDPIITEHRIYEIVVVPGSLHLARLLYVVQNIYKIVAFTITEVKFISPLVIATGKAKIVQLIITQESTDNYSFKFASIDQVYAQGYFMVTKDAASKQLSLDVKTANLNSIAARCSKELNIDRFDKYFAANGLQYQLAYKWLAKIKYAQGEALGFMRAPLAASGESKWLVLQAGQIDCAFQTLISIVLDKLQNNPIKKAWALLSIDHIKLFAKPHGKIICHNVLRDYSEFTSESRKAVCDITFYDEQSNLIAEFNAVTVSRPSKEKILSLLNA